MHAFQTFGFVVLALLGTTNGGIIPEYKLPSGGISPNLNLVGVIDSKAILEDHSERRTWAEAKQYCEGMSMELASINTPNEWEFLKASKKLEFITSYWTSGRDANSARQFVWDGSEAQVSETMFSWSWLDYPSSPQSCFFYYALNEYSQLRPRLCSQSSTGVLCQFKM